MLARLARDLDTGADHEEATDDGERGQRLVPHRGADPDRDQRLEVREDGRTRAAVLTFAEPVVAVVVGAAVWREPLSPLAIVGGALVLGAGIEVARKAR